MGDERPGNVLHVKLEITRGPREAVPAGFSLEAAFDVPPGTTVLFGPSGSGKSTALAAIAGLVRPTAGRIALGAEVWCDTDARIDVAVHERRIAFVFQSLALFPHLSARRNVAYGMDRALDREAKGERADALLRRLRVGHLADRKPSTFSGGEAQRVALARALATTPRVVLLDEPFSALDHELRLDLLADLRALVAELGVPVMFVTHHRDDALAFGDRLVMLDAGRVVRTGPVETVLS